MIISFADNNTKFKKAKLRNYVYKHILSIYYILPLPSFLIVYKAKD